MRLACLGLAVAAAAGCSFEHGASSQPTVTVGFAQATSLQDHLSGNVMIPVVLDAPSAKPIFVDYMIGGGTAVAGTDYAAMTSDTLAFPAGTTQVAIPIAIYNVAVQEPDTTVDLTLSNPNGAALGQATHEMTISGVILPRVAFSKTMDSAAETTAASVDVVMDKTSAFGTTVDLQLSGTAVQGVDYSLGPNTLVFPAGTTTYHLDLGVIHDNEFNTSVDAVLTLANATKMIIGTPATYTHTITEADPMPTVSFMVATSSVLETGTMTTITVKLSAASRLDTTIPFTVNVTSTAVSPTNYTLATASPLTIPAGMTSATITVMVADDGTADNGHTLVLDLGAPTNATLGATARHTLTIADDDQTCTGQTGTNFRVCMQKPAAMVTLTGAINTGSDPRCITTPFSGWTGQQTTCFIVGTQITVSGTLAVSGTRPLALIASDTITVTGTIDASATSGGKTSPGTPPAQATCGGAAGGNDNMGRGEGGGAGGSFRSVGGDGGNGTQTNGGAAGTAQGVPTVLRTGCPGHLGGNSGAGGSNAPGPVGLQGGAVYLAAVNGITLASGSVINVSGAGAGAAGSTNSTGGSGGGSGGMIKLEAPAITATGAILMANGGGGASGTDNMNGTGNPGGDASAGTPTTPAAGGGGSGQGGAGGSGFAGGTAAGSGPNVSGNKAPGGGGGGGGGGDIEAAFNGTAITLTGATVSAGP